MNLQRSCEAFQQGSVASRVLRKFLKEKHLFKGQWITTLPKVNKGCGNFKGKSCKVKVDNVRQNMSEEELVNYFFLSLELSLVSTSSY